MKWRLHRSVIFWSGILVMLFIVWAWRDSLSRVFIAPVSKVKMYHFASGIAIVKGDDTRVHWGKWVPMLGIGPGPPEGGHELGIPEKELLESMRFARPGFHRFIVDGRLIRDLQRSGGAWVPVNRLYDPGSKMDPALRHVSKELYLKLLLAPRSGDEASIGWVLFIPHWIFLAAFAVVWGGVLLWRARRGGELTNAE